jgi:hypothetical protein
MADQPEPEQREGQNSGLLEQLKMQKRGQLADAPPRQLRVSPDPRNTRSMSYSGAQVMNASMQNR